MESRLRLTSLHFNENSKRQQYQNQQGESQYTITFPKYKKGGYIVRKLMEDCTYGYMDCLFEELTGVVNLGAVQNLWVIWGQCNLKIEGTKRYMPRCMTV